MSEKTFRFSVVIGVWVIALATIALVYDLEVLISAGSEQQPEVVSDLPTERCDSPGYALKECLRVIITNEVGVRLPMNQPPIDVKFSEPVDVRVARSITEPVAPGSSSFDPLYVENSILNPLWVRVAP